jgi:hypothetical protein
MLRQEYRNWTYWEDFAIRVIREGLPYTQRELRYVIDQEAYGAWEGFSHEMGDNLGPRSQSAAEDHAAEIEGELRQIAREANNLPATGSR